MHLVTSLEAYRSRRTRHDLEVNAGLDSERSMGGDPYSAIDEHTRSLAARTHRQHRRWIVPRALILADVLGLTCAYAFATVMRGGHGAFGSARELGVFVLMLACWIFLANVHGLYRRDSERADHSTTDDIVQVVELVALGILVLLAGSWLLGRPAPHFYGLALFLIAAACLVPLLRFLARQACKRSRSYEQNAVVVGAGDIGQRIARKIIRHPEYGVNLVGFVDRHPKPRRVDLPEHLTVLGAPEQLPEIVQRLDVERVVIAFSNESETDLLSLLRVLRALAVQIDLVPRMFELASLHANVHWIEGMPLLGLPAARRSWLACRVKRLIDLVGASFALLVLAPLLAYIAIRIRRDSPGPILFRQVRVGARMRHFTVLKFRTMKVGTDDAQHRAYIERTSSPHAVAEAGGLYKLDRGDAVTPCGRWLRRTSLDELPQLLNVVRGEMSLVGPRPCIPYEVDCFAPHHLVRFEVPQGITGLWQVAARANSTYGESLDMDVAYVLGWSLGLDLRLLLRTPLQMLRQRTSTA